MAAFARVVRSHRIIPAPPGNDGHRHAGNGTAGADRPLASASPLGLPGSDPALPKASGIWLKGIQDEAWDALVPRASSAGDCTAPRRIKVALPGPLDPKDEARFRNAFDEVALQLPPDHTQQHLDACAEEAWEQCFGIPVARTSREQVWASVPRWCLVDEGFARSLAPLFQALPDNYTDSDLLRALEQAWEASQGDNWQ